MRDLSTFTRDALPHDIGALYHACDEASFLTGLVQEVKRGRRIRTAIPPAAYSPPVRRPTNRNFNCYSHGVANPTGVFFLITRCA